MSDDEEQFNPSAHKNLLQAISSLGKVQHIRQSTRSEAQQQQDEFQLVKGGRLAGQSITANKVGAHDIVQLFKTTPKHLNAGKQLKNVKSTKKVLAKPLEKPVAERIKRTIGYEKVKKQLERWDAVVAKNRSAETQVFPLKGETIYVDTARFTKPLEHSIKSDLMLEMEATEAKLKAFRKEKMGDKTDEQELAKREEELYQTKLTRDELIARRKELAYLKIRESQKSAKARMRNKIKSKKYHKLLKRQKIQEQLKEFELLQKTNPEAALEKLNELEKQRVLERASLRHKNTGSWAKNLQVRAKYDTDVRKDLAEQLQMSRQLTQKKQDSDSDDNEEQQPKSIIEQQERDNEMHDPFNPWTRAATAKAKGANAPEEGENWRKYWLERNVNEKKLKEHKADMKMAEEAKIKREEEREQKNQIVAEVKLEDVDDDVKNVKVTRTTKKSKTKAIETNECGQTRVVKTTEPTGAQKHKKSKTKKAPKIENGWLVEEIGSVAANAESIDDIFDAQEDIIRTKLNKKLMLLAKQSKKMSKNTNKMLKPTKQKDALANLKRLSFKNDHMRPIIDEELNNEELNKDRDELKTAITAYTESQQGAAASESSYQLNDTEAQNTDTIDPHQVATVRLKQPIHDMGYMNESLADVDMPDVDEHPDAIHQMTITEAFEDDDIVADFSKDKAKDSELKNTIVELSMPGWGSWAGAGISKEHSQHNKRFVLNLAEKMEAEQAKRRDRNKSNVYINEEASKHLRPHLVSDLPFPFTSLKDFEASIRAPLGRNYVTETAFRMQTRPAVITQKGQVIEPMDESELVKPARHLRHIVDKRIARLEQEKVKA